MILIKLKLCKRINTHLNAVKQLAINFSFVNQTEQDKKQEKEE